MMMMMMMMMYIYMIYNYISVTIMIIHHSSLIADRCDTTTASLPGWSVWEAALADGKQRGAPPKKAPNEVMLKWVLICRTVSHPKILSFKDSLSWFLFFFHSTLAARPIVLRSGPSLETAATGQLAAGEVFTTAEVRDNILRLQAGQGESYKLNSIWKKEGGGDTILFFFGFFACSSDCSGAACC